MLSSFSPKVHLATGVGYPVIGTLMVRGWGTMTSRPFLKAPRSKVGPTERKGRVEVRSNQGTQTYFAHFNIHQLEMLNLNEDCKVLSCKVPTNCHILFTMLSIQ